MSIIKIKWEPVAVQNSDLGRRAEFPAKPWIARDLLEDFKERAGSSPLTEEALARLWEVHGNRLA